MTTAWREVMKRSARLWDWIKKGRMTIGGFYCSMNTDFMSLETLHRSVYYTTERLSREFGIHLEGAILDDVNGFTWGLPEVMAKAGLRYLVMGSTVTATTCRTATRRRCFTWPAPMEAKSWFGALSSYGEGFDLITYDDP